MIIPTAEPFFLPGNRVGCLLVHGFTGAPKEMRWMGEFLNQQGYTVLGSGWLVTLPSLRICCACVGKIGSPLWKMVITS